MRLSRYFLPGGGVLKETPSEAQIVSHRLMLRAGHDQAGQRRDLFLAAAGLQGPAANIEKIVHEEQARAGHMAMLMPTIQSADLWRESGRYDATARRCCASRTGTTATCCSPPRRRS
jgi:prolyl-tRNA synthetase